MLRTGLDQHSFRVSARLLVAVPLAFFASLSLSLAALSVLLLCGCSSGGRSTVRHVSAEHFDISAMTSSANVSRAAVETLDLRRDQLAESIVHASFQEATPSFLVSIPADEIPVPAAAERPLLENVPEAASTLTGLETLALAGSPSVLRFEQQVQAAWAKAGYADKLPDPTIGANVFGDPIETAAGSQRANLSIGQMIPWLGRLDAKSQRACFEALSVQEALRAEQLRVTAEVRIAWYRLFVLGRQIEIVRSNEDPLKSLISVANAQIEGGRASEADVKLGTLELSRLAERLIVLRQQVESTKAELNRVIGRDANASIPMPKRLDVSLPNWSHSTLRQMSDEHQPAIVAARLNTQATRWGIEVARLERRPNVAINASWFLMDDNRPASTVVDVGQDAWSLGAQVSVPIWRAKNDAIENEASWKHSASNASVAELTVRYDAMLRNLWEQARAADETRQLYSTTILPQARETRDVDIQAFSNGTVEFDRVIRDFLNVLAVEEGLYRATGQLAMNLARIEQAVGIAMPMPIADRSEADDSSEINK